MKIKILIMAILMSASGTLLFSCQSSVENAKDNVQDAKGEVTISKSELNAAIKDSLKLFKENELEKILANVERLKELKTEAMKHKKYKAKYEKLMAGLEQKNNEMKTRLVNYKAEGEEMWLSFRQEFYYDMTELEKAMNNLFEDNK